MLDMARQRVGLLTPLAFTFLVVALTALSLFLLAYTYLAGPSPFNADDLYCSDVCADVLHRRDMTGWHLPGAPYLFPDILLLVPCQSLTTNIVAEFLAYCLLLHLCLFGVLAWLGRLTGLDRRQAVTAAACGVMLLAAVNLDKDALGRACLLVHPGSHVGAILVGLFLLALTVRSLRRGFSVRFAVVFLLAGALATFSDKLLAAQLLAPLGVALVVLAARRVVPIKVAVGHVVLLGATVLFSFGIAWMFRRLGFQLWTSESEFTRLSLSDLPFMLRRLNRATEHAYVLRALIAFHLAAALLALWYWFQRSSKPTGDAPRVNAGVPLTALTLVLSPPCIFAALFVMGAGRHPGIDRYMLSCWFLPCLLLPLLMRWLPGRIAGRASLMVQVGVVLLVAVRAAVLVPALDRAKLKTPYPPLAQALDRLARERGPLRGLSSYWLARSTNWFNRENVVINPLLTLGEPWFHGSNPCRFLPETGEDLRTADCQFLVVEPGAPFAPDPDVLVLHFGTPTKKIAVGSDEIWLYDSLRSPPFDRFLRSRLAERLCAHRPYVGPSNPACLAHPKANLSRSDAACNVALEDNRPLDVRFARPIAGRVLDVAANYDTRFDLDFYMGEELLASLTVPAVPWTGAFYGEAGIQSRLLSLPEVLHDRTWDRIRVLPRRGAEKLRLAHLLVFAESVDGLEDTPSVSRPSCVRLEGERLMPVCFHHACSNDADATASGGFVRRAPAGFTGPFAFTPNLTLPPGRYRMKCALQIDGNPADGEVVRMRAWCVLPAAALTERPLRGSDFPSGGGRVIHELTFEIAEGMDRVLLGVVSSGKASVALDYLEVIAEPPAYLKASK